MLGFFKSSKTNTVKPLKGYKVTNVKRTKKYGIAADSLVMLKDKASTKFELENARIYLAADGTEVQDEEYFATLEAQSLFIIAADAKDVKTDFEVMYAALRSRFDVIETGDIIRRFVTENRSTIDRFLIDYQNNPAEQLSRASTKEQHAEWFAGQPIQLDSKEKVMARRSQDRIRGYLYKTKDDLCRSDVYKSNRVAKDVIDSMLEVFRHLLTEMDYFSHYFNRQCVNRHPSVMEDAVDAITPRKKARENVRSLFDGSALTQRLCVTLCDNMGAFRCQGLWNRIDCAYDDHTINPYASRENAILFQIWNLDHRIEISRSIIPSILESVALMTTGKDARCPKHKRIGKSVSVIKYFLEIFTVENLKFVHIVCHDKGVHEAKSQGRILCEVCKEYKFLQKVLKAIKP